MMYVLIIAFGIIVSMLLFAHLPNETRMQNKQVHAFFDNLAVKVFRAPEKGYAFSEGSPIATFPLVSTSSTCGRQGGEDHQLDFPISTTDKELAGTAAEFTIEPDAQSLRLYVRLLEQPYMWICDASYSYVKVVVRNLEDWLRDGVNMSDNLSDEEKFICPPIPIRVESELKRLNKLPPSAPETGKEPLWLGDRVFLGNMQFVIAYDRRGK